jgi:hypothetical protein
MRMVVAGDGGGVLLLCGQLGVSALLPLRGLTGTLSVKARGGGTACQRAPLQTGS